MAFGDNYIWAGKKILIVEDDESSTYLLDEILKNTGVSICHAKTGTEAVSLMQEQPDTDVVLMDIQLPEMDGLDATAKIRKSNNRVKIITQTAYSNYLTFEEYVQIGADDFVHKPINAELLLSKINRFLH